MNDRMRGLPLPGSAAEFVASVVRPEVRAQKAYVVAPAAGLIKLEANENPWALPDAVKARLAIALAQVPLNRYPEGGSDALRATLRRALAIPDALGLIVGNGSDELIQLVVSALARPGATVLVQPDVTAGPLYLTSCEVADKHADYGREVQAELKLTEPGSVVVDRAASGFL